MGLPVVAGPWYYSLCLLWVANYILFHYNHLKINLMYQQMAVQRCLTI